MLFDWIKHPLSCVVLNVRAIRQWINNIIYGYTYKIVYYSIVIFVYTRAVIQYAYWVVFVCYYQHLKYVYVHRPIAYSHDVFTSHAWARRSTLHCWRQRQTPWPASSPGHRVFCVYVYRRYCLHWTCTCNTLHETGQAYKIFVFSHAFTLALCSVYYNDTSI